VRAPEVSIVLIFLDEERYLAEAIESVNRQSCNDWELILVDDGSSDRSAAIAAAAAERDPRRVRVLRHAGGANLGMSASRNLGLHACRGEFVSFLDGDDVMPDNKVAHQSALLAAHRYAAGVAGPMLRWWSWNGSGRSDEVQRFDFPAGNDPELRIVPPPALVTRFVRNTKLTPGGCLFRRSVLMEEGGYEPAFRGMYEDQIVLAKLFLTRPILLTNRVGLLYRRHAQSAVAAAFRSGKRGIWRQRYLQWLRAEVDRRRITDPELGRAIRDELWRCRFSNFLQGARGWARGVRRRGARHAAEG